MKHILFLILFLRILPVLGQNFSYPTLTKEGCDVTDFIPKGWTLLQAADGDLNSDNHSVNFLSEKYSITREEMVDDKTKSHTEQKAFRLEKLKTLKTLGKPFKWDFESGITI